MSEGKEVGFFGGGAVKVADGAAIAAKMNESAQNDPRGGIEGSDYLNFSGKKGTYVIGKEERKIDSDELWVVHIGSFEDGWVCWKGGRPASTRMANIFTGVPVAQPDMDELGPFNVDKDRGEGWFQAKALILKSCDSEQQGYFKINSKSGVSAIAGLQREISERIANDMDRWPVVRLDVEEFEAQGFKNYKPVFQVEGWLSDNGVMALAEGADISDLLEGDVPQKKVEVKDDDDSDDDEAPRRRRRKAL